MITLVEFEEILNHIKKNEEDNRNLTDILVSSDCTGFTMFGSDLVHDIVILLSKIFNDEHDFISWWLWDSPNHFVWWEGKKYDLTEVKDLYYWLKGEYDLVKSEVEDEPDQEVYK